MKREVSKTTLTFVSGHVNNTYDLTPFSMPEHHSQNTYGQTHNLPMSGGALNSRSNSPLSVL